MEERTFLLIKRLTRWLTLGLTGMALALFLAATLALTADIVMRYGFNRPLSRVHEATTIAFVYVFLLGAAVVYVRQQEVAIDFLADRLSERQHLALMLFIHLAIAAAALVLTLKGWELAVRQARATTPSLGLPRSVYGMAVVVSGTSFVLFALVEAWATTLGLRKGGDWSVWPLKSRQEILDEL